MDKHPSCSDEQQIAEKYIVSAVAKDLGLNESDLAETALAIEDKTYVNVDGYHINPNIICEAWSHVGKPKVAQTYKVMNDALKMIYVEKALGTSFRKILAFCDVDSASKFLGNSWHAKCLQKFDIEVKVVAIPEGIKESVIMAQKRQFR